jgi:hypothetical protein
LQRLEETRLMPPDRARTLSCCLAVLLAPVAMGADSPPASLRQCFFVSDPSQRLDCYDREIAPFMHVPPAEPGPAVAPPASSAAPLPPQPAKAPDVRTRHVQAHITRIEDFPDRMIVHLDNGEVWEQVQEASTDLHLHSGDAVTIERELGSYWLSGPNSAAMKVRRKP